MASIAPYAIALDIATGAVDLDTHTFKLMLLTSSYTPAKTHSRRSDLTNEVSGTGYTAGGEAITFTVTRSSGVTSIAPASVTWSAPNGWSARYGAIYRVVGGAASGDPVVLIVDFGSSVASNGNPYIVSFSTAMTITVP